MKYNKLKTLALSIATLLIFSTSVLSATIKEGIDLYNDGQYDKAIKIFSEIVKTNPDDSEPHKWLAKCYEATFDIKKSIDENKIYQELEYRKIVKEKTPTPTPIPTIAPTDEPISEDVTDEEPTNKDLTMIDNLFLYDLISKRSAVSSESKAAIDFDKIKLLFSEIPTDKNKLNELNKNMEIKKFYEISSHENELVLEKTNLDILTLRINEMVLDRDQETNSKKRAYKNNELSKMLINYQSEIKTISDLINKPVFTNTDPLTYEYYKHIVSETSLSPENYVYDLKKKKEKLQKSLSELEKFMKDLTGLIKVQDEKLINIAKNQDTSFINLESKQEKDKKKLADSYIEKDILIEAIKEIDKTLAIVSR